MKLLSGAGAWLRARVVRDANILKLWSVQITALGAALFAFLLACPEQALAIWNVLPPEIQSMVPNTKEVALFLMAAVAVARVIKQGKPNG